MADNPAGGIGGGALESKPDDPTIAEEETWKLNSAL